mmetsp:Transcript_13575/g.14757  ORF Transcript_13575/g.14757 Transcript_13575/m.14757 type:complete len:81 (-) Transcript_13575:218-460(-)
MIGSVKFSSSNANLKCDSLIRDNNAALLPVVSSDLLPASSTSSDKDHESSTLQLLINHHGRYCGSISGLFASSSRIHQGS